MDVSKFSEKRCLHYWSKIYSNNLREGGEYKDLKKTICIWILNGSVYDEFEDFQSKWKIMNEKHMVTNHFQELEFHVIELKKFRKLDIMKPSKKEFWLWFIDHSSEELVKMSCVSNEEIKKAHKYIFLKWGSCRSKATRGPVLKRYIYVQIKPILYLI